MIPNGKSTSLYSLGYCLGMGDVNAVHLPEALIARVDVVAADELRTRSNLVRLLVSEGLARGESGAQDEDKVESR